MSTVIPPTVGRIVWYHPSESPNSDPGFARNSSGDPLAAIIARVWNDNCVNLTVFDANGVAHSRTSVRLIQEGEAQPELGFFCEWMPYQKGQAAKQDAPTQPTHRQNLEMSVAAAMATMASCEGADGTQVGKQVRLSLDALLGQGQPAPTESIVQMAERLRKEHALVAPIPVKFDDTSKDFGAIAIDIEPQRVLERSRVCGVDCQPGGKNCNNYCNHDRSTPMASAPATYATPLLAFGHALEHLKVGSRIARTGWNGKGMFIFLNGGSIPGDMKAGATVEGVPTSLFNRGDTGTVTRMPNINMRAASGSTVTGWLASQTDMLAEDWVVVL